MDVLREVRSAWERLPTDASIVEYICTWPSAPFIYGTVFVVVGKKRESSTKFSLPASHSEAVPREWTTAELTEGSWRAFTYTISYKNAVGKLALPVTRGATFRSGHGGSGTRRIAALKFSRVMTKNTKRDRRTSIRTVYTRLQARRFSYPPGTGDASVLSTRTLLSPQISLSAQARNTSG